MISRYCSPINKEEKNLNKTGKRKTVKFSPFQTFFERQCRIVKAKKRISKQFVSENSGLSM